MPTKSNKQPKLGAGLATLTHVLSLVSPAAFANTQGPTAVFNEAVKVVNGVRQVQLPPFSNDERVSFGSRQLPPTDGPEERRVGTFSQDVYMIETEVGLVECVMPMLHDKHCRPSTYGVVKLKRTWTVLRKGVWQNCSDPNKIVAPVPDPHPDRAKWRHYDRVDRAFHCKPFKAAVETSPGGKQSVGFGILGIDPPTKAQ